MSLHVIAGPMFSGKTTRLIYELERQARGGKKVVLVSKDTRFDGEISTHSGHSLYKGITRMTCPAEKLTDHAFDFDVFGVDEFQFEKPLAVTAMLYLATTRQVEVAGLLSDFQQKPFEPVQQLIIHADVVDVLTAVCQDCKSQDAIYNIRLGSSTERIQEGAEGDYKVICRRCLAAAQAVASWGKPATPKG